MSTKDKRLRIINALAILGYISVLFQWLWGAMPYVPGLVSSDVFKGAVPAGPAPDPLVMPHIVTDFPWLSIGLAILVVLGAFVILARAMQKAPKAIEGTAQKVTRQTAAHVIPVVTHHVQLTPQKRRQLTARIIFDMKLAILFVPLVCAIVLPKPQSIVTPELFVFIAALLAGWSLLLFCTEVALARYFRLSWGHIW